MKNKFDFWQYLPYFVRTSNFKALFIIYITLKFRFSVLLPPVTDFIGLIHHKVHSYYKIWQFFLQYFWNLNQKLSINYVMLETKLSESYLRNQVYLVFSYNQKCISPLALRYLWTAPKIFKYIKKMFNTPYSSPSLNI